MSVAENKRIVRLFESACVAGDLAMVDGVAAPKFNYCNPAYPGVRGPEGFRRTVVGLLKAFPDLEARIEDMIAEGDKVVVRYSFTGTHRGEFQGISPTDKTVRFSSIVINRVVGGKVVDRWEESDLLGIVTQLGPEPPIPLLVRAGYFEEDRRRSESLRASAADEAGFSGWAGRAKRG